jgi:hypothetical protein
VLYRGFLDLVKGIDRFDRNIMVPLLGNMEPHIDKSIN